MKAFSPYFAALMFPAGLAASLFCSGTTAPAPPPGITVHGRVVEVYDGDTLTVEVTIPVRVRLLNCWAPEVTGLDRQEGVRSRDHLRQILPSGSKVLLHVPASGSGRLDQVFTFGRALGHVWSIDDLNDSVSDKMVRDGFATTTKKE